MLTEEARRDHEVIENFCEKYYQSIIIEDNGVGFNEEELSRLFQRLHGRNEYEDTGIGLATCRKIVERHGGGITAKSTPQQGTTFIVTLPVRPSHEENDGR